MSPPQVVRPTNLSDAFLHQLVALKTDEGGIALLDRFLDSVYREAKRDRSRLSAFAVARIIEKLAMDEPWAMIEPSDAVEAYPSKPLRGGARWDRRER